MPIAGMPTFFPTRLSQYVPGMRYASSVSMQGGAVRVSFGAPALAVAAGFLSGQSIATAVTVEAASMLLQGVVDAPWGRTLTVVASGAATSIVTVNGWDYLGQPMTEQLTLNGATPVAGVKCFKRLRNVVCAATAGTTINLGFGALLGLPFKAIRVLSEESDNAPATLGTLTAPVLTSPATNITGDTRGRFTANTTLNGVRVVTAMFIFDNSVNDAGAGGLHGVPHFAA